MNFSSRRSHSAGVGCFLVSFSGLKWVLLRTTVFYRVFTVSGLAYNLDFSNVLFHLEFLWALLGVRPS